MCKILAVTTAGIEKHQDVIFKAWEEMRFSEKHGYGSAWDSGESIGYMKSSFHDRSVEVPSFCEGFGERVDKPYNGGPIIVHGRTATCEVGLQNTHPFVIENYALVHNGVVESTKYKNQISTCDSELILQAFMYGGVKEVAEHIQGWMACFIIEKLVNHTILHVFKDTRTSLYVGKVGDSYAFGTTEALVKTTGASIISAFKDDTYVRFNGNQLVHQEDFEPKTSTSHVMTELVHVATGEGNKLSKKQLKKMRREARYNKDYYHQLGHHNHGGYGDDGWGWGHAYGKE